MANNDYITTDCKLTVSKNTAKLDEEIFLYKNDRNIKLLIEIVDNKYRYKSDDLSNLLVKYKASYAQVKWYKNAEVKKEFPIQATDDGKVVFVIEGQLIDEDTELGDYDLQLRLLNESQESIRSLPIIKGAVHILKPLFEEGDIATVNSAVADVSMLSLDGDAIDTYNSDGTYNQTNWGSGDIISSSKLNKLEKVAKDNVDKVNKIPAKSIVEGGKIYLAKEDGTKLDSGTELPAGGSTIEVVNNLESDSTTAALSAAQGKALNTQYKDIANNQPTDLSLDSATNLLQLVNSKGSKLGNGITLPISSGGGTSQYLHIKYSTTGAPQLAGQISDTPNAYIGLCVDANADAPINPHSYTWYKWKGEAGAKGDTGATPSLQIGTVETLESGSSATASITGTTENPLLNLGIPRGEGGTGGSEKEWKLLKDLTLTETVSAITEIFDNDYKEILIIAKGKAGGTSNCGMAITSYSENQASGVDLVLSSILWKVNEECTFSIYLCAENPVLFLIWKRCNSSILSSSEGTYNSANWNDKKGINKLLFRYGTFAEGNNYKIYGR